MSFKKQLNSFLLLGLWATIIFQSIPHAHHVNGQDNSIEKVNTEHHHHFFSFLDTYNEDGEILNHTDSHYHLHDFVPKTTNDRKELKTKPLFSAALFVKSYTSDRNNNFKFHYNVIRVCINDKPFLLNNSLRAPPILG